MSRYSKFNSLNDYKNLSKMITNSSKDDLSNLLTPSDNNTNKDNVYIDYFQQTQFVGSNSEDNMYIHEFFSQNVVNFISNKCTQLLDGVDEKLKRIFVPD